MNLKFNQKTIDDYPLNAIRYVEKLIVNIFFDSFTNDYDLTNWGM
jgi:hypothetical protein